MKKYSKWIVVMCTVAGVLVVAWHLPAHAADAGQGHPSVSRDKMKTMDPYTPIEVGQTKQFWGDHTFEIMVEGGEWKVGEDLKVTFMVTLRDKKKEIPVTQADVSADLTMNNMGHNLEHGLHFAESKPGAYTQRIRLEMAGTYNLLFNFQKGNKMHAINFNFVAK